MRDTINTFAVLLFLFGCLGFVRVAEAKDAGQPTIKPTVSVHPSGLSFNCNSLDRTKEVAATNVSSTQMTITARASEPWIRVEPAAQSDIGARQTALFKVNIDCKAITGARLYIGFMTIEGLGSTSKIRVSAKPKLTSSPRRP